MVILNEYQKTKISVSKNFWELPTVFLAESFTVHGSLEKTGVHLIWHCPMHASSLLIRICLWYLVGVGDLSEEVIERM